MKPMSSEHSTSYRNAVAHYLSPRRRDPVKVLSEEVVTHRVLQHLLAELHPEPGQPLRVLDIGCGLGDGLSLLTEHHAGLTPVTAGHSVHYTGIDADPEMIDAAHNTHDADTTRFMTGDMRTDLPSSPFDVYLSCGVPYSHLTYDETVTVLTTVMRTCTAARQRAGLVVDVLGRYSIEWVPRWQFTRWNYNMTFFEDATETIEDHMTFFSRQGLHNAVTEAAHQAEAHVRGLSFTDRSVMVGRHTATRAFNQNIPPYRTLLNSLARGDTDVPLDGLLLRLPAGHAPPVIHTFFRALAAEWNAIVEQARCMAPRPRSPREASDLAAKLLGCERRQRGLGAGHSLTATMIIEKGG